MGMLHWGAGGREIGAMFLRLITAWIQIFVNRSYLYYGSCKISHLSGQRGFNFRQQHDFSLHCHVRAGSGGTPCILRRVKRPKREAEHSPASRATSVTFYQVNIIGLHANKGRTGEENTSVFVKVSLMFVSLFACLQYIISESSRRWQYCAHGVPRHLEETEEIITFLETELIVICGRT
jgi:hypothetical protein